MHKMQAALCCGVVHGSLALFKVFSVAVVKFKYQRLD